MRNEIVELTKKLITIPSDVQNREACIEALKTAQSELSGLTYQNFASNGIPSLLYTNKSPQEKQFKIILNAHLDVVPSDESGYTPIEKDGRLYGRGAYDMKGAAAVMMLLFKELAPKLNYALGLQITTDEEVVGYNGTGYQLASGIQTEFAITGESTNFRIINEVKTRLLLKLTTGGKSSHAAYPWLGQNAIMKMYEALQKIYDRFPTPTEEGWMTTVNTAKIETTNMTHNKVPADCTAILDIRIIPEEHNTLLEDIRALVGKEISIEVLQDVRGGLTPKDNKYIQLLKKYLEEKIHTPSIIQGNHGGSDIIFYAQHNYPAIEFGPIGHAHHGQNEWVDIQSLEDYYHILKAFLLSANML
jgi:succinyl-diaminopimelate desuccinylase